MKEILMNSELIKSAEEVSNYLNKLRRKDNYYRNNNTKVVAIPF